jgi:hypothetical protein
MTALIRSKHCRVHQVTCVSHPNAEGELIHTEHLGSIRVVIGPAQYTLNTGEVVKP